LHDVEGFSYEEVAMIVGEKLGTVRSRIHYGRQKLRELLEPYYSARSISQASR
jgi:RNA polymerase sigma-70 factor (ECF subfamily)